MGRTARGTVTTTPLNFLFGISKEADYDAQLPQLTYRARHYNGAPPKLAWLGRMKGVLPGKCAVSLAGWFWLRRPAESNTGASAVLGDEFDAGPDEHVLDYLQCLRIACITANLQIRDCVPM